MNVGSFGMPSRIALKAWALALIVPLAVACPAGDKIGAPDPAPPVFGVTVTPDSPSIVEGRSVVLSALLTDASGAPLSGQPVQWSTNAPSIVSVSTAGMVTALQVGRAVVTATTADGHSGSATVTVVGWVLVGAGDIAYSNSSDEATAQILDSLMTLGDATMVFTAGDNAYEDGTFDEFMQYYDPTWGRHKARTRPSPGNHEYQTADAAGYFQYFGFLAGPPGRGYYSYDWGSWHIVSLNTNIAMAAGSEQEQWLRADLAATTRQCVLAYWHHPRFSSHGGRSSVAPLYQALYDHNVEVVVVGHHHIYERFAPQDPNGTFDPQRGVREFIVGTGGRSLRSLVPQIANSEVLYNGGDGVIKFTLNGGSYTWEFISEAGKTFTDTGTDVCH